MSRDASITLTWADGDYVFRLGWGEIAKLQEAVDAGPYVVYQRLLDGTWRVGDISHTIRFGLIGGGMPPTDALKKVRDYVEARPPLENLVVAQAILSAALAGAPDEKLGEAGAADRTGTGLTASQMEKSGSPRSTASVQ